MARHGVCSYLWIVLLAYVTVRLEAQAEYICLPYLAVANGMISYEGIVNGSTARLICNTGFKLNGTEVTTCFPPRWSPELGKCNPALTCQRDLAVENGNVSYLSGGNVAVLTCDAGFKPSGSRYARCSPPNWIPALGVCKLTNSF